jgi:AcrR family transcriptional regulator
MSNMAVAGGAAPEGLRERKRRRTRQTIARVALELFDRQGFRGTTLAEIAEAADVSPRTVSGYFANKEALAFPDADLEFQSLCERLESRVAGETTTQALRDWVHSYVTDSVGREAELTLRQRVVRANEDLRNYERGLFARAQRPIAEAIAVDLGMSADDLEPRMAAAATLTILEQLGGEFGPASEGVAAATALEPLDRVLVFVDGGIAALRGEE